MGTRLETRLSHFGVWEPGNEARNETAVPLLSCFQISSDRYVASGKTHRKTHVVLKNDLYLGLFTSRLYRCFEYLQDFLGFGYLQDFWFDSNFPRQ